MSWRHCCPRRPAESRREGCGPNGAPVEMAMPACYPYRSTCKAASRDRFRMFLLRYFPYETPPTQDRRLSCRSPDPEMPIGCLCNCYCQPEGCDKSNIGSCLCHHTDYLHTNCLCLGDSCSEHKASMRRREAIAGKVSVPGKEDELHAVSCDYMELTVRAECH